MKRSVNIALIANATLVVLGIYGSIAAPYFRRPSRSAGS